MRNEHLGERWFLMDHADNRCFFQSYHDRFHHRRGRRDPLLLPGKTCFTEEFVWPKNCNDCFLSLVGNNGALGLPFLNVEDRIRGVSLRKDDLVLAVFANGPYLADLGEKGFRIKRWSGSDCHDSTFCTASPLLA